MPAYEIGRELRPMRVHAEDKGEKGLQYSLLCISLVSAASSSSMEYMEVMFVRCNTHTHSTYIYIYLHARACYEGEDGSQRG